MIRFRTRTYGWRMRATTRAQSRTSSKNTLPSTVRFCRLQAQRRHNTNKFCFADVCADIQSQQQQSVMSRCMSYYNYYIIIVAPILQNTKMQKLKSRSHQQTEHSQTEKSSTITTHTNSPISQTSFRGRTPTPPDAQSASHPYAPPVPPPPPSPPPPPPT
jgi:hypothetical protein